jgi:hypothetical protein
MSWVRDADVKIQLEIYNKVRTQGLRVGKCAKCPGSNPKRAMVFKTVGIPLKLNSTLLKCILYKRSF